MPIFAWWFILSAGFLCIAVEVAARLIQAIGSRRRLPELDAANATIDLAHDLSGVVPAAKPLDEKDLVLAAIHARTDAAISQRTSTEGKGATPFFSWLTTIGTKNVFLAVGVALLLIPALIGQGVSIDFNGNAPAPSPVATP